jgi:hypothetical protein
MFKGVLTALAGTALVAASATTAPATRLYVARAATPAGHGNEFGASVPGTTLISIGILAALVVGVLVATGAATIRTATDPESPS